MIHEEICTYEVCKLAKEKGFPQAFNYTHFKSRWDYYNHKGELNGDVGDILKLRIKHKPIPDDMQPIAAPTQSLLQRWLREEKNIVVEVGYYSVEQKYYWRVYDTSKCEVFASFIPPSKSMSRYDTWEQALESGLKYALKELK